MMWASYEENLEDNLQDLSGRLARGAYRAKPVRRTYIPKADGRLHPLGIPTLEDKLVQGLTKSVLEQVYELDFTGFSYGCRPGRGPHRALDALATAIRRHKVSWVLDADIRGFFDAIDHDCLMSLVEHRIGDQRVLRRLKKWLNAGVLENGKKQRAAYGSSQGGSISPLLANVYMHYALDLWITAWRKDVARGERYVVRYVDDFVVCFQYGDDARRFLEALKERFAAFHLELHPDKTRGARIWPLRGRISRTARRGKARDLQLPRLHPLLHEDAESEVSAGTQDTANEIPGQAQDIERAASETNARADPSGQCVARSRLARARPVLRSARQQRGHGDFSRSHLSALVHGVPAPESQGSPPLGSDEPAASPLAPSPVSLTPGPMPASTTTTRRRSPVGSAARRDLSGGLRVTGVPAATPFRQRGNFGRVE